MSRISRGTKLRAYRSGTLRTVSGFVRRDGDRYARLVGPTGRTLHRVATLRHNYKVVESA